MKRFLALLVVLAASLTAVASTSAASGAACAAPASGGAFVGTFSVDSANPDGTSYALPSAAQYTVVACGTWANGGIHVTDAEYLSLDNWSTHQDGYDIAPFFNGPNFGDLEVNNAFVNWGAYSASHTYSVTGSFSGALNLSVFDGNGNDGALAKNRGWYGDNHGSLAIDVYRALPATADQCKNSGWQAYGIFKNQGDCVSYVATHGKNQPG